MAPAGNLPPLNRPPQPALNSGRVQKRIRRAYDPQDLVGFLSELHALKVDLFLRQQGLDTTTPAGKAMFQM